MPETPFMPKATAVWLVENTTLTFKQIAEFCNLHELEIKGIADGDVAKGIKAYNPILAGQLSREEIEICSKDPNKKYTIRHTKAGVSIDGLNEEVLNDYNQLEGLLARAQRNKSIAATSMNKNSSRSHCCFTLKLVFLIP